MCAHREQDKGIAWSCINPECSCKARSCAALNKSETAQDNCLILPLYPQMTDADQDMVITTLTSILEKYGDDRA